MNRKINRNNDAELGKILAAAAMVIVAGLAAVWWIERPKQVQVQHSVGIVEAAVSRMSGVFGGDALPEDLRQRAQAGDAEAQYQAGRFYLRRNRWDKAVPWYGKAAAQGHPKAQNNLGVAYMEGRGVKADKVKGCRLLKQAQAQMPSDHGAENVALCSDKLGDYDTAFAGFLKQARQGSAMSMRIVAQMYQSGDGTEKNDERAVYWFRQAALKNDARAMYSLGLMYAKKEGVPDYGGRNSWAGYVLIKAAQAYQTEDDAKAFKEVGLAEKLAGLESKMPLEQKAGVFIFEQSLKKFGMQKLLQQIDEEIPYTPPAEP